jgi:hypothetical protein
VKGKKDDSSFVFRITLRIGRAKNTGAERDCQRSFRANSLRLTGSAMSAILCDFECGLTASIQPHQHCVTANRFPGCPGCRWQFILIIPDKFIEEELS